MKVKPLQIHWHNKQPIFALDFQRASTTSSDGGTRLATAGGDNVIRIWRVRQPAAAAASSANAATTTSSSPSDGTVSAAAASAPSQQLSVDYLSSLAKHSGVVNVVRWSPIDEQLASAGDDGMVLVWKRSDTAGASGAGGNAFSMQADVDEGQQEWWVVTHMLRGPPMSDIYDLCWSPCARYVLTGSSIDNSARIWDLTTKRHVQTLSDHGHFVQGVAWDPRGEFIATQSSDRSVHIYRKKGTEWVLAQKSTKMDYPEAPLAVADVDATTTSATAVTETADVPIEVATTTTTVTTATTKAPPKSGRIYHDETLVSFFRRLTFTPDGSLLLAPAGIVRTNASDPAAGMENCVHVYARNAITKTPAACLPGYQRPAVVVKCSPVRYEPRPRSAELAPFIALPYRLVFAVGTQNSIFVYDTQQMQPLVQISHIHYATITDLAWSSDGNVLMVSSADGFCSVVCFENGELGVPIVEATKTPGEEHMEKSEVSEVTTTIPTVPTSAMVLDPPIVEPSSSSSSTLAISDVTVKTLTTSMGTGTLTAEQDTTAADPNKKRRIMPTFVSTVTSMGDVGGNNQ